MLDPGVMGGVVLAVVTTRVDHCRELADQLFMNDPDVRRFDTLPVFEAVKTGLEIPMTGLLGSPTSKRRTRMRTGS